MAISRRQRALLRLWIAIGGGMSAERFRFLEPELVPIFGYTFLLIFHTKSWEFILWGRNAGYVVHPSSADVYYGKGMAKGCPMALYM